MLLIERNIHFNHNSNHQRKKIIFHHYSKHINQCTKFFSDNFIMGLQNYFCLTVIFFRSLIYSITSFPLAMVLPFFFK